MNGYRTVVVGTDGSESSMRAVTRAGEVAAGENAKLIIASAHVETVEKGGWSRAPSHDHVSDTRAADSLGGEQYILHGNAPVYGILREAHDKARAAGAEKVEERAIDGAPVPALVKLVQAGERRPARRRRRGPGLGRRTASGLGACRSRPQGAESTSLIVHTAD